MTRVRCRQSECIFWDNMICTADGIELDPEQGCLTLEELEDLIIEDEDEWDEDVEFDDEKWEDEDWDDFPYL